MSSKHGIVSPWAGLEPTKTDSKPETPRFGIPEDPFDDPSLNTKPLGVVVLEGQGFEIHVYVPKPNAKSPPSAKFGNAVLGACLQKLFQEVPALDQFLQKQSIYRSPPLGPVTTLVFDTLTLYAKAGSLHPRFGVPMAIDRLSTGLLETVGWVLKTKSILDHYRVEIVRKG